MIFVPFNTLNTLPKRFANRTNLVKPQPTKDIGQVAMVAFPYRSPLSFSNTPFYRQGKKFAAPLIADNKIHNSSVEERYWLLADMPKIKEAFEI